MTQLSNDFKLLGCKNKFVKVKMEGPFLGFES